MLQKNYVINSSPSEFFTYLETSILVSCCCCCCVVSYMMWGYNVCCAYIRSFDDGFPNLFINNAQEMRGQHVTFLAAFSSPAVIFEQLSVIYALPRLFVASFTLVLPFLPTGKWVSFNLSTSEFLHIWNK